MQLLFSFLSTIKLYLVDNMAFSIQFSIVRDAREVTACIFMMLLCCHGHLSAILDLGILDLACQGPNGNLVVRVI